MLAWAIAADEEIEVGAMDLDICGPSLPRMLVLKVNQYINQIQVGHQYMWRII